MSKKTKEDKYTSIKVPKETREQLKDMGIGISKAVQVLVTEKQQQIEEKIQDISEMSEEFGQIIADYGLFDLKFAGASIENVTESGEMLDITAHIKIILPHAEVRQRILEALSPKKEEEQTQEVTKDE